MCIDGKHGILRNLSKTKNCSLKYVKCDCNLIGYVDADNHHVQ